jgi:hypothetical protein
MISFELLTECEYCFEACYIRWGSLTSFMYFLRAWFLKIPNYVFYAQKIVLECVLSSCLYVILASKIRSASIFFFFPYINVLICLFLFIPYFPLIFSFLFLARIIFTLQRRYSYCHFVCSVYIIQDPKLDCIAPLGY